MLYVQCSLHYAVHCCVALLVRLHKNMLEQRSAKMWEHTHRNQRLTRDKIPLEESNNNIVFIVIIKALPLEKPFAGINSDVAHDFFLPLRKLIRRPSHSMTVSSKAEFQSFRFVSNLNCFFFFCLSSVVSAGSTRNRSQCNHLLPIIYC